MAYLDGNKSFNEIEDVDDNTFLNHPRQGHSGYILNDNTANNWEDNRRQILLERRQIEDKTLQSTKNSLGLIYETEKVGLSTAEELLHQKEQLNNVNDKLDSINSIMRVSQKHLTSMKSIFGGFKNYFSKNTDQNQVNKRLHTSASENVLQNTINSIKSDDGNVDSQLSHPALKRKGFDAVGFYDEKTSDDDPNTSAYDLHSKEIDRQLDLNLEEMGMGISRLKDLAQGLGNEIDSQNQLIDNIATKSERAQDTISNQNRQMKRILKS